MSNLGPLQTDVATEPTLEAIEALLQQFTFNAGDLNVTGTFVEVPSGLPAYTSRFDDYAEVLVPYNTETTIVSYTVPVGHTGYVIGFVGSGDTVGEFYVRVDGTKVGYGRSSASDPTCPISYADAPIPASPGQIITVSVITYENAATHTMRANLIGGLV
jgi:hypothetical protein